MKMRFRIGVLLVALVATLGAASPAMAKGGGGGGGGGGSTTVVKDPCATVNSWNPTVETVNGQPTVVLHVGVLSTCVDEGIGAQPPIAVGLYTTDTATGAWVFGDVKMTGYGQRYFDFYIGALTDTPPARTLTLKVTRPNGQLQYSRTTTLAEVMQAAQAATAAA